MLSARYLDKAPTTPRAQPGEVLGPWSPKYKNSTMCPPISQFYNKVVLNANNKGLSHCPPQTFWQTRSLVPSKQHPKPTSPLILLRSSTRHSLKHLLSSQASSWVDSHAAMEEETAVLCFVQESVFEVKIFFFYFGARSSSIHCLTALDFGAGVEQPFDCLIVQSRQAMQSMRRSVDWTLEDNIVNGLFLCATLT